MQTVTASKTKMSTDFNVNVTRGQFYQPFGAKGIKASSYYFAHSVSPRAAEYN